MVFREPRTTALLQPLTGAPGRPGLSAGGELLGGPTFQRGHARTLQTSQAVGCSGTPRSRGATQRLQDNGVTIRAVEAAVAPPSVSWQRKALTTGPTYGGEDPSDPRRPFIPPPPSRRAAIHTLSLSSSPSAYRFTWCFSPVSHPDGCGMNHARNPPPL